MRTSSTIDNSYATGSVIGSDSVGGLLGKLQSSSSIDNSYAFGSVNGSGNNIGGFVGNLASISSINNSYATGSVSGNDEVGGFVGFSSQSSINHSYSSGTVNGRDNVGGFIGLNEGQGINDSIIYNSFCTGNVTGLGSDIGGFAGNNSNTDSFIINSYWNNASSPYPGICYDANSQTVYNISDNLSYFYSSNVPIDMWDTSVWRITGTDLPILMWQPYTAPATSSSSNVFPLISLYGIIVGGLIIMLNMRSLR